MGKTSLRRTRPGKEGLGLFSSMSYNLMEPLTILSTSARHSGSSYFDRLQSARDGQDGRVGFTCINGFGISLWCF